MDSVQRSSTAPTGLKSVTYTTLWLKNVSNTKWHGALPFICRACKHSTSNCPETHEPNLCLYSLRIWGFAGSRKSLQANLHSSKFLQPTVHRIYGIAFAIDSSRSYLMQWDMKNLYRKMFCKAFNPNAVCLLVSITIFSFICLTNCIVKNYLFFKRFWISVLDPSRYWEWFLCHNEQNLAATMYNQ